MDPYLVVEARIWEFSWGNLHEFLSLSYENITKDCAFHVLAIDGPSELQQCILLGASYVQKSCSYFEWLFPIHSSIQCI